jgi:tetratricopeptide (TPR) repeat protein
VVTFSQEIYSLAQMEGYTINMGSHTMQRSLGFVVIIVVVLFMHLPVHAQEERGNAYYDLGVFAYEDGDYKGAEINLKKALAFSPNNPFFNHYMGRNYLKMERYQEAGKYLNKAWNVNPDIPGLHYDRAFLNYKRANYSSAADLFTEIVKEDPSNVLAHYYAGICFYKQKNYRKALNYFIDAAQISPTIKDNGWYYAGICHLKLGNFTKAVEKFEYVRDHAESTSLREYAKKWLQAIEKQKRALKPYSLYVKLSYKYDDNVRLEPVDEDIYADEDDYVTVGCFSGRYNIINRHDYKMGVGYSHYQTWHSKLENYDLVGSIFDLYAQYTIHPFTLMLSYLPTYYWVESDKYLMRHHAKPEVMWKVNENLVMRFSYSYYKNDYFQDDTKDGNTNEVFLSAYYSLKSKRGYLFGGIGYEDNSASHPDHYYVQLKTKLGISLNLPWDLNLKLTGKYYDQDYDNVDSFYGIKREDAKYYGAISLCREIFYDWLSISGEFNYTKNDSNISDREYKQKVTTVYLTARF